MDEGKRDKIVTDIQEVVSISLAQIDQCNRLSNTQIIEILKMVEAYVDPLKNKNVFENVDDELARRISSFTVE